MVGWKKKLIENHAERIFFGSIATFFGVCFVMVGCLIAPLKELFLGAGSTILIGVAQLAINKTRSPKKDENNNGGELNETITAE